MPVLAETDTVLMGQNEILVGAISFSGFLRAGETISSVTSVTISPAGPDITNAQVTGSAQIINGISTPAAEAITFTIDGDGSSKGLYTITATVVTTGSQTLIGAAPLKLI